MLFRARTKLTDDEQPASVVSGVEIVHWNPTRSLPDVRGGGGVEDRPVANFGDLLGPAIVRAMHARARLGAGRGRIVALGSILHFAGAGDVVWGAGRNGKIADDAHPDVPMTIAAVRGPLTADWLRERGYHVPNSMGDPAILLPDLFPEVRRWRKPVENLTVLPNLNDWSTVESHAAAWHPRRGLAETVRRIARSRLVAASSLHGIIVAEALGVPVRPMRSAAEHEWKYEDWFAASGRPLPRMAETVEEAVALGPIDAVRLDTAPIAEAFPSTLWG